MGNGKKTRRNKKGLQPCVNRKGKNRDPNVFKAIKNNVDTVPFIDVINVFSRWQNAERQVVIRVHVNKGTVQNNLLSSHIGFHHGSETFSYDRILAKYS